MSILNKYELRALAKSKMRMYCKLNNISVANFLQLSGIQRIKWGRITAGKDTYFSAIKNIVTQTKGFFTYQELAALLEEPPSEDWIKKVDPKLLKKVIDHKIDTEENEQAFGKDPLDVF